MMSTEGEVHALVRGQARVTLKEMLAQEPYLIGKVEEIPEEIENSPEVGLLVKNSRNFSKKQ